MKDKGELGKLTGQGIRVSKIAQLVGWFGFDPQTTGESCPMAGMPWMIRGQ